MTKPVVVGVDGSREAGYALVWAAREAVLRRTGLRIVNAAEAWEGAHRWSEEVLAQAERHARAAEPELDVTIERRDGRAVTALTEIAPAAGLIVVGRRGTGGFAGLLLGSVAHGVSQLAAGPVVAVPAPELPLTNRVVVGVDGSDENEAAVGFAFEEASLRTAELRAVHAWTKPTSTGPGDLLPLVYDLDDAQEDESRLLAESLAGWRERYPDVKVDAQTVRGHTVRVLDHRSSDAAMLVVGRRGATSRVAALLGSVAHGVLHHARCPVAVVPTLE